MDLMITFWGTRGSIPTPGNKTKRFGGNTSCVQIRHGTTEIICDAGTGIRALGDSLVESGRSPIVAHLFFSHLHWDHIQGFPFFLPAYLAPNQFYIYGPDTNDDQFFGLLSGQMDSPHFPVKFADLRAHISPRYLHHGEGVVDSVTVRAFRQHHPGVSFGYSFSVEGKKVVYATDNEIDGILLEDDQHATDSVVMRKIPETQVDFVRGADLLIADGQYTDEEYPNKTGWGHSRASTAVDLAVQAKVRSLAIFHHDPTRADADIDRLVDSCRDRARSHHANLSIFAAREGVELKI